VSFSNALNSFAGSFTGNGNGLTNVPASGLSGPVPGSLLAGSYSNVLSFTNAGNTIAGNGSGLTNLNAANLSSGVLPVARGGTGAPDLLGARANLGAAARGPNSDITSLSGLTTALSISQGGSGAGDPTNALLNFGAPSLARTNIFSGVNKLTNALNILAGDGGGITNLNPSTLTGTVSPSRGGTGFDSSSVSAGSIFRATAAGLWGALGPGADGQTLKMSGGTPVWSIDNDTTYSAGTGLTLSGNMFSVSFGGSGVAGTVSRSDHQHSAADLVSGTLPDARLAGAYSSALNFNNIGNSFTGNGAGLTGLNASQLNGTIRPENISPASITGTMLAVGAVGSNQLADSSITASKLFTLAQPLLPSLVITNPAPGNNSRFGTSIAAVGSDQLIVGTSAGVAYLFRINNGQLLHTFTIPAGSTNSPLDPPFGSAVSSAGSNALAIGGAYIPTNVYHYNGAQPLLVSGLAGIVYLFSTNGSLITSIVDPEAWEGDRFGANIIDVGGGKILIADPNQDAPATYDLSANPGASYLFSTNGVLLAGQYNPLPTRLSLFGSQAAAVGDGQFLISFSYQGPPYYSGALLYPPQGGGPGQPFTNGASWGGSYVGGLGNDKFLMSTGLLTGTITGYNVYNTNGTLLFTIPAPTPRAEVSLGAMAKVGSNKVAIGGYVFQDDGTLVATLATPSNVDVIAGIGNQIVAIGRPDADVGAPGAGVVNLYSLTANNGAYSPGFVAERVTSGAITTTSIADGAVTADKIGGVLSDYQIPALSASKITGTLS